MSRDPFYTLMQVAIVLVISSHSICLASDGDEIDTTGCPKGKSNVFFLFVLTMFKFHRVMLYF